MSPAQQVKVSLTYLDSSRSHKHSWQNLSVSCRKQLSGFVTHSGLFGACTKDCLLKGVAGVGMTVWGTMLNLNNPCALPRSMRKGSVQDDS